MTPWAVIGTNASAGEIGASAFVSRATSQDYSLNVMGAALGYKDWLEVSLARQDFDASPAIALNGIAPFGVQPGQKIKMDILGLKLRVMLDGQILGETAAKTYFYRELPPGKHVLSSMADSEDKLEIDLQPGTLTYV